MLVETEPPQVNGENETKQKRRRPVFVSRACTNCRKAHTKCDEQKPCSRCTRLGIADSCQVAEMQKRGRKRKTEAAASSTSQATSKRVKNSANNSSTSAKANTPATEALQNFSSNPFDLNVLLNEDGDSDPFLIDELVDMSSSDHSGKVHTESRQANGFTVYDENYINFLLSADMGNTVPVSPQACLHAQQALHMGIPPQVIHQECSKQHAAISAYHQQAAIQQSMLMMQQAQIQQQAQVVQSQARISPTSYIPPMTHDPSLLNMLSNPTSVLPQSPNSSIHPISPQYNSTDDSDAEDLREQIRRLQVENSKLKSTLSSVQTLPPTLSDKQLEAQRKFENQNLRFNENEDNVGLLVSTRNGNIISMNDYMREKLGYSKEDIQVSVTNWQQLFDTKFWPSACAWAEKNINEFEENAALANCVFKKKGAHDPPLEGELLKPKAFTTKFCYDCTSRALLFSITKVYF